MVLGSPASRGRVGWLQSPYAPIRRVQRQPTPVQEKPARRSGAAGVERGEFGSFGVASAVEFCARTDMSRRVDHVPSKFVNARLWRRRVVRRMPWIGGSAADGSAMGEARGV